MHTRPVRNAIKNTLEAFNSSWFTKVRAWNPERIVDGDFATSNLPMAGVEIITSLAEYGEPQSIVKYGIMIYVIVHEDSYTATDVEGEHEDMMCDLAQHIWRQIYSRFYPCVHIGDTDQEIVLKARLERWNYRAETDVFRAALEYLRREYLAAWFNVVLTTKIVNPTS